jgi:hypothetical protein
MELKSRRALRTGTVNNLVLMIRWADCPFPVVSDLANNITGLPSVEVCARLLNSSKTMHVQNIVTGAWQQESVQRLV